MSRVLWASAAIAIGISLTPSVALAANGNHSRPHSANSRHNSTNNDDGAARTAVLAIGAGYAYQHGSAEVRSLQRAARRARDLSRSRGWPLWPADSCRCPPPSAGSRTRGRRHRRTAYQEGACQRNAGCGSRIPPTRRISTGAVDPASLGQGGILAGAHRWAVRPADDPSGEALPAGAPPARRRDHRSSDSSCARQQPKQSWGCTTYDNHARAWTQPQSKPEAAGAPPAVPGSRQSHSGTSHAKVSGATSRRASRRADGARRHRARGAGHRPAAGSAPAEQAGAVWRPRRPRANRRSPRNRPPSPRRPSAAVPEPSEAHEPEPDSGGSRARTRRALRRPSRRLEPRSPRLVCRRHPKATGPTRPCPNHRPSTPSRAEQVKVLQRQLGVLGFDPGPVDGRYGPQTTDAVKHLQEVSGLRPDGIVGPLTAEVLRHNAPEPPTDDRAERVKALQRQLSWLGFEPGPADGQYGSLTTGAVKRFQEAYDLLGGRDRRPDHRGHAPSERRPATELGSDRSRQGAAAPTPVAGARARID